MRSADEQPNRKQHECQQKQFNGRCDNASGERLFSALVTLFAGIVVMRVFSVIAVRRVRPCP